MLYYPPARWIQLKIQFPKRQQIFMSKAGWWKIVVREAVRKWHRRENTENALQKEKMTK